MNSPTAPAAQILADTSDAHKNQPYTQFGALCYRMAGRRPEILLITSRRSERWILPKGWPVDGKTPVESAEIEAWEEAGVRGRMYEPCLGFYSYHKTVDGAEDLFCVTMIYAMKVRKCVSDYPEAHQRKRKWFSSQKAAAQVVEPGLAHLIRHFDPARIKP